MLPVNCTDDQTKLQPTSRVTLHSARVGRCLDYTALSNRIDTAGGKTPFRPRCADDNSVPLPEQRSFRVTPFDSQRTQSGLSRPERSSKMIRMECRHVDRLLQVHIVQQVVN